jgi:hypothetical protein
LDKTANLNALSIGTLRDQAYHIKANYFDKQNKVHAAKIYCTKYLNEMPIGARKFQSPLELMGLKLNLRALNIHQK